MSASPAPDRPARGSRAGQVRFALTFAAIAGTLLALYFFPYPPGSAVDRAIGLWLRCYARVVAAILGQLEAVSVDGTTVSGRFSMTIVHSCDGMEANILFCAAVLAVPGRWSRKLACAAGGLLAIVACNIVRLCSLYYVGVFFPQRFDVLHLEVWPLLLVAFASLDFLVCVRWMSVGEATGDAAG